MDEQDNDNTSNGGKSRKLHPQGAIVAVDVLSLHEIVLWGNIALRAMAEKPEMLQQVVSTMLAPGSDTPPVGVQDVETCKHRLMLFLGSINNIIEQVRIQSALIDREGIDKDKLN